MHLDLAIKGGLIASEDGLHEADLGVVGGRVSMVAAPGSLPAAEQEVGASGLWVLPGAVDIHFHCRAPAHPHREDFTTGTSAAASGGVTTLLEMPLSDPPAYSGEIVAARRRVGEEQAVIDFGLYAAPGTLDPQHLASAAAEGAVAFKVFMHAAPPEREREFTGVTIPDTGHLYQAFRMAAAHGLPVVCHCEDDGVLRGVEATYDGSLGWGPKAHARLRPREAETVASAIAIEVAAATGVAVHLAHVTCREVVDLVRDARRRGRRVTMETCPHYLRFDETAMERCGPYAKVNPPLRTSDDIAALWEAVLDGTCLAITTDHSPFAPADKETGWDDIRKAFSGSPGVDMLLPFVYDRVLRSQLSVAQAVRLISGAGARFFGVFPQKGSLRPGSDADFVLFDPAGRHTVDPARMFTKAKESARLWAGETFAGRVIATYSRGELVYREGQVVGRPGRARFVRPNRPNQGGQAL